MNIEAARAAAAEDYPEFLTDSKGREHPSIARKAILSGAWDTGSIVRRHLVEKEGGE
ncbi:hypothetical protein [Sphingomonas sp. CCH5-D11]|uniref:hypothetical protein n=1 Tax=Sphingomonas sp. CCH5-D11 TaxID=1768786 RepID=UPI000A873218|nr:hypothetical protein [Sphingomonas sp. CCH5-D11]